MTLAAWFVLFLVRLTVPVVFLNFALFRTGPLLRSLSVTFTVPGLSPAATYGAWCSMTERQVLRLVDKWTVRLGVQEWRVKCFFDEHAFDPADENTDAYVVREMSYRYASVYFNPAFTHWDAGKANRIVCHELLHLALNEMSWGLQLAIPAALDCELYDGASHIAMHCEEVTIDKLAWALVQAFGES